MIVYKKLINLTILLATIFSIKAFMEISNFITLNFNLQNYNCLSNGMPLEIIITILLITFYYLIILKISNLLIKKIKTN